MDRRDALKIMGGSAGYVLAASSFGAFMAACKTGEATKAGGTILSGSNLDIISQIAETILPATKTPGAIEAGVPAYINKYLSEWAGEGEADTFVSGLKAFNSAFEDKHGASFEKAEPENQNSFVMEYANRKRDGEPSEAQQFFNTMKSYAIGAYFNSELIGENHLNYNPIPGEQKGCVSLEEASGGILWSPTR